MSILIKNVSLNGKITDIGIEENRITKIASGIEGQFETVIDGSGHAALPPFYNTHCHAAMTLLRGIADDMELHEWLTEHIWPAEGKLTLEDIYWGSRLACAEMIRSGTVFFNDMYFEPFETIRAVEESGIRAAIGMIVLNADEEANRKNRKTNAELMEQRHEFSSRIQIAWAPHAIYTVPEKNLRETGESARECGLPLHIHLAETDREVQDCLAAHGCTPTEYLARIGCLSSRTLAAHAIYLNDRDMEILRENGVNLAYNPCSNYKLSSGRFHFRRLLDQGIRVTIGTDGCASNNSLSMFDEMKMGAIGAKLEFGGPTGCSAEEIYRAATRSGAEAFGIDGGLIEEGRLADMILVNLDSPMMVADHNLTSNLVYAADSSCVSTVICDGKVLMRDRQIPGLEEIVENARRCARHLK